jgi:hypothetical protein
VRRATLDRSPELLDTLWGYYFGTGTYGPIARIIVLLPWSNDRDSLDKLTIGSMAKYTTRSRALFLLPADRRRDVGADELVDIDVALVF